MRHASHLTSCIVSYRRRITPPCIPDTICFAQTEKMPHSVLISIPGSLQLAGVLIFSATPFVAVKAFASSSVGESLQRRLLVRKEEDRKQAEAVKKAREEAKQERSVAMTTIAHNLRPFWKGRFLHTHS